MSPTAATAGAVAVTALVTLYCRRRPERTAADECITNVSVTGLLLATGLLIDDLSAGVVGLWIASAMVMTAGIGLLQLRPDAVDERRLRLLK